MSHGQDSPAESILRFWMIVLRLKELRRSGWVDRGVADPESAAAHSWGVALLSWILAGDRPELHRDRVLLLGLIHDLPEAVAGDPTPFDDFRDAAGRVPTERFRDLPAYSNAARRMKQDAEVRALEGMLRGLPGDLARAIKEAWEEYERGETPEARFVRQIDKLETLLQAEHYQALQPELVIESFRLGTRRDVTDQRLVHLIDALENWSLE